MSIIIIITICSLIIFSGLCISPPSLSLFPRSDIYICVYINIFSHSLSLPPFLSHSVAHSHTHIVRLAVITGQSSSLLFLTFSLSLTHSLFPLLPSHLFLFFSLNFLGLTFSPSFTLLASPAPFPVTCLILRPCLLSLATCIPCVYTFLRSSRLHLLYIFPPSHHLHILRVANKREESIPL